MRMEEVGLPCDTIFQHDPLDSEIASTEKMLLALEHELPELCDVFEVVKSISDIQTALQNNRNILQTGNRAFLLEDDSTPAAGFPHSEICGSMVTCTSPQLIAAYRVLLRLIWPRHPPYALTYLTFVMIILRFVKSLF